MYRHLISLAVFVIIVASVTLPGLASAQVAAPNLNPGALMATATNPAVLQWSGPSRVSLGYFKGDNKNYNILGVLTGTTDLSGPFYQARVVGQSFSAGAEQLRLSFSPVAGSGDYTETQLGLAAQVGGSLAVGVGQDKIVNDINVIRETDALVIGGVSWRMSDRWYLGLAYGSETHDESPNPHAKRPVTRFGAAYHYRDKADGFHAEIHRETRGERDVSGVLEDDQQLDSAVVELIVSNFFAGMAMQSWQVTNTTNATTSYDEDRQVFTLGWVPAQGMAITARTESRVRSVANGSSQDRTRNRITVVWQF